MTIHHNKCSLKIILNVLKKVLWVLWVMTHISFSVSIFSLKQCVELSSTMCHGCGQLYSSAAGFPIILVGPESRVHARGPQDPN